MFAGRAPGDPSADRIRIFAPAKINLFLHAGEKRPDGYHNLESLIVFAEVGDRIELTRSGEFSLSVTGPFASALPGFVHNLAFQAACELGCRAGVQDGVSIALEKNLPVASGIGGGSADAAAVLRGLKSLWGLTAFDLLPLARDLGSDVPVCLLSRPCWVEGRGEILTELTPLPWLSMVLVNPGVAIPTAAVFGALNARSGTGRLRPPGAVESLWDLIRYLGDADNDLEGPACELAPVIQDVLNALEQEPGCAIAAMSGSGGTCFGIFHEHEFANGAASRIAMDHSDWWVAPTRLAGPDAGKPI